MLQSNQGRQWIQGCIGSKASDKKSKKNYEYVQIKLSRRWKEPTCEGTEQRVFSTPVPKYLYKIAPTKEAARQRSKWAPTENIKPWPQISMQVLRRMNLGWWATYHWERILECQKQSDQYWTGTNS